MTEPNENVREIRELPIFPLPLVLFPGEMIPLHIFEPRYREMLADIGPVGGRFGLIYFEPQDGFTIRPDERAVGTIAEIAQSELMDDGRSNIVAVGIERFRLIEYVDGSKEYFQANVATFSDEHREDSELEHLATEAFDLFTRVTRAAHKMSGSPGSAPELKMTDHETLSFLIAAGFGFDNEKKYQLLIDDDTEERLQESVDILRNTAHQIEHTADVMTAAKTNGHSKKKLDL